MPRNVCTKCNLRSKQSYTNVQLSFGNGGQCICSMSTTAQYDIYINENLTSISEKSFSILAPVTQNPCHPSPCGPNSQCREINGQAVCSCVVGYIGTPPTCRPECVVSSECPQNEACSNQKCRDPCPGTCGIGAKCTVINHNPICSCLPRYTGDPFVRCQPIGIITKISYKSL